MQSILAAIFFLSYIVVLGAWPSRRWWYRPTSYLVIWDDHCSFCRWWITWFRRLDWLGVLRFEGSSNREALAVAGISKEDADQEIKLVVDGRVYGGFDAVRRVLAVLPLSFTWEPVLRLPPIRALGDRVYRAVAIRRRCLLPVQRER